MTAKAHLKPVATSVAQIPFQDASMDIWDKKYRLKKKDGTEVDTDLDATYQRVAKALAEVETAEKRE
jgi:ribonucleoside-diphosphate reductase alpha chain